MTVCVAAIMASSVFGVFPDEQFEALRSWIKRAVNMAQNSNKAPR